MLPETQCWNVQKRILKASWYKSGQPAKKTCLQTQTINSASENYASPNGPSGANPIKLFTP